MLGASRHCLWLVVVVGWLIVVVVIIIINIIIITVFVSLRRLAVEVLIHRECPGHHRHVHLVSGRAKAAARLCALNGLAVLDSTLPGGIDSVLQIVRLGVFVCSDRGFHDQPQVANGASELMEQVFGESGRHARAAVGVIALPLGAAVEVELSARVTC